MKSEYEDIVSMLTLPETIAQTLLLLPGHLGNKIGIVRLSLGVSACSQCLHIENCLRLFLLVVVMETIVYTCAPSFTSMCATLIKFEE